MAHLGYYQLANLKSIESNLLTEIVGVRTKISEIYNTLYDKIDRIENYMTGENNNNNYDNNDSRYTMVDVRDDLNSIKDDIYGLRERLRSVDSTVDSIRWTQTDRVEKQLKELDDMIRYGPISQVMLDAKSDFESRI